MNKRVVLKIEGGSFEQGFPVTVQIGDEHHSPTTEATGKLPAAPELLRYYQSWQSSYENLDISSRLTVRPNQTKNRSFKTDKEDCKNAAQTLEDCFKEWLCSPEFRPIREKWLEELRFDEEVRVILQSKNYDIQKLPWHLWDVLERYPRAEVALCSDHFQRSKRSSQLNKRVKILAILGDSQGINTEKDRALLKQLPDADVTFLVEPARKELNDQLWDQQWDILFFAGHSSSQGSGFLAINREENLSIQELKHALQIAVSNGLQIAILNSCQGLKLAHHLAELNIPQTILMREQVPDRVAQEFLKYFLTTFAKGEKLYSAVRSARERLQGLEDEFLCATWLPVIYQNLAEVPPTWADLKRPKSAWIMPLVSGLVVAATVLGVRHVGLLQAWELQAYDQMLQVRSLIQPEPPDNRILVVEITDQDIEAQKERKEELGDKSLSNTSLVRLLKTLNKYQPRVIGLDLYRDAKGVPAGVVQDLQQTPNLIGICKSPSSRFDPNGIAPPAGIPTDRVGFSDMPRDSDGTIRRHLLQVFQEPDSSCPPQYAFSVQVALHYLQAQGIQPKVISDHHLQLGGVPLKPLVPPYSAYQKGSDLRVGDQILLNYRSLKVRPISLTDVLKDQQPLAIKDRIVLIGVTHQKTADKHLTPFSTGRSDLTPGVFIQAQKVSQILSAVLDNRPLIWVWAGWVESVWIVVWAIVGGVVMVKVRSSGYRVVGVVILSIALWGICMVLLIQGGWISWIPAWVALTLTSGIVVIYQFAVQSRQLTK